MRIRNQKNMKGKKKRSDEQTEVCHDCKLPITWKDLYIVRPEVWAASGLRPKGGCLHLACLEARIGRKLEIADFLLVYKGEDSRGIKVRVLDLIAYIQFNSNMDYYSNDRERIQAEYVRRFLESIDDESNRSTSTPPSNAMLVGPRCTFERHADRTL